MDVQHLPPYVIRNGICASPPSPVPPDHLLAQAEVAAGLVLTKARRARRYGTLAMLGGMTCLGFSTFGLPLQDVALLVIAALGGLAIGAGSFVLSEAGAASRHARQIQAEIRAARTVMNQVPGASDAQA